MTWFARLDIDKIVCGGKGIGRRAMIRPKQKSTALMLNLISKGSRLIQLILNPFSGTLSTSKASALMEKPAKPCAVKGREIVSGLCCQTGRIRCEKRCLMTSRTWLGAQSCWFMHEFMWTRWMRKTPKKANEWNLSDRLCPIQPFP